MFIPIIVKPVDIRFIRKPNGSFELCFIDKTGMPLVTVNSKQFSRLFPGATTSVKVGLLKMDKSFAEAFFKGEEL